MNKTFSDISNILFLQLFMGVTFLIYSYFKAEFPEFVERVPALMRDSRTIGGMFIVFALNTLFYINKYKKIMEKKLQKEK